MRWKLGIEARALKRSPGREPASWESVRSKADALGYLEAGGEAAEETGDEGREGGRMLAHSIPHPAAMKLRRGWGTQDLQGKSHY